MTRPLVVELLPELRGGVWCGHCLLPAALEGDVIVDGVIVAVLQGCPTCLTGIFAVKEKGHG